MDGVTNTDVPPIVPSVEDEIEWLCNLPAEDLEIAKGSSKLSGISLARAKQLSVHMSLNRCFNKSILIDNIIKKRKRVSELAAVHSSETVDQDSDDGKESKFISNVNTFPRICNIILDHPDALIRSALLASKYALQNKETNQNQPIFKEAKEKFNDISYNSGGIISDHPELLRAKIDPELHNTSGKITSKHLFLRHSTTLSGSMPPLSRSTLRRANIISTTSSHTATEMSMRCINILNLNLLATLS